MAETHLQLVGVVEFIWIIVRVEWPHQQHEGQQQSCATNSGSGARLQPGKSVSALTCATAHDQQALGRAFGGAQQHGRRRHRDLVEQKYELHTRTQRAQTQILMKGRRQYSCLLTSAYQAPCEHQPGLSVEGARLELEQRTHAAVLQQKPANAAGSERRDWSEGARTSRSSAGLRRRAGGPCP